MMNILISDENSEKEILLNGKMIVRVRDILYVESSKPYIILHFENGGKKALRISLIQFEEILRPHLIKAGRKYLVNLAHVREISANLLLDNGGHIRISRAAKAELKKAMEGYFLKKHQCQRV